MASLPAAAASAPLSNPRIALLYDLAAGQQPESIVVEPDGSLDIGLSVSAQVERVDARGQRRVLAALPLAPDGGPHTPLIGIAITTGLVRAADGTLYIGYAAGDSRLTGIWRAPGVGSPAHSGPAGGQLPQRHGPGPAHRPAVLQRARRHLRYRAFEDWPSVAEPSGS